MFEVPMAPLAFSAPTITIIDSTDDHSTNIFIARKTGSISSVVLRSGTIAGSPQIDVRIEQCTQFAPTGVLVSANSNAVFSPTSNTTHTVNLTSSASVTKGQIYAVKLVPTVADGSNTAIISFRNTSVDWYNGSRDVPATRTSTDGGVTWSGANADAAPSFAPVYDDGEVEKYSFLTLSGATLSFRTTHVTHAGCRFTAPANCDVIGANYYYGNFSTTPRTLKLLSTTDTELATEPQQNSSSSITNNGVVIFSTPYTVTAGTDYRLVFVADSSTQVSIPTYPYPTTAIRQSCHPDVYLSHKTGSTWTDADDHAPLVVPILSNFQSGGGGGGGGFSLIGSGGLVY